MVLGILRGSPGRLPAAHRPPGAHLRNLLSKHCHTPSGLAGGVGWGGGVEGCGWEKRPFLAHPEQGIASSCAYVTLPAWEECQAAHHADKAAELGLVSDYPAP